MNMKVLIEVLLCVWQLPQNLLGLLLRWLMWTKVQIIQGKLCDVLDNVFREDARWDQPRTLHRAPLPLSSLIIEHIRSENNSSRNMVTHGSRFIAGDYICLSLVCRLLRGLGCILHSSVSAPSVIMTSTPRSGLTDSEA